MKRICFYISIPLRIIKTILNKVRFKSFGWTSIIENPLRINGSHNISIGNHVSVHYKTWLAATDAACEGSFGQLIIEDGCTIGAFNHIYATQSIIIRKNVLTADKVYIADNAHDFRDVTVPIMNQPILQKKGVEIGEGSWLGENVCVIGSKIGKHSVIGANSVVTHDIPDYSVAVGAPARVIKRYDFTYNKWLPTSNNDGACYMNNKKNNE